MWFKAWVCRGRLLGMRFESRRWHERLSLVSVVYSQVQVSATDISLIQRIPAECGVSEYDHESSIMRRPWPTRAVAPW